MQEKVIVIIAAMQMEVDALKIHLQTVEEKQIYGIDVWAGTFANKKVVLAKSGVGKVNATMTMSVLMQQFNIQYVINIGTAGGLLEAQQTFDIVIADQIVQHDFDSSVLDGSSGLGIYSKSDEKLVKNAKQLFEKQAHPVYVGCIATGDQFISTNQQIDKITSVFKNVIACEMEAGGIAYVCNFNKIPCIVIRSLSDNTRHPQSHLDFVSYAKQASETSAAFCLAFISE